MKEIEIKNVLFLVDKVEQKLCINMDLYVLETKCYLVKTLVKTKGKRIRMQCKSLYSLKELFNVLISFLSNALTMYMVLILLISLNNLT